MSHALDKINRLGVFPITEVQIKEWLPSNFAYNAQRISIGMNLVYYCKKICVYAFVRPFKKFHLDALIENS